MITHRLSIDYPTSHGFSYLSDFFWLQIYRFIAKVEGHRDGARSVAAKILSCAGKGCLGGGNAEKRGF